MRIKKGDKVVILSGKDRGMTGKVLRVDRKSDRVVVEGRAIVHRHKKAMAQGQESGIIARESAIHASNVALFSEKLNRGVRVCSRYTGKDGELFESKAQAVASFGDASAQVRKVRFAKKTGEIFD